MDTIKKKKILQLYGVNDVDRHGESVAPVIKTKTEFVANTPRYFFFVDYTNNNISQ